MSGLDAFKCLNSLRYFASQRGAPGLVNNDDAKTFKSTENC